MKYFYSFVCTLGLAIAPLAQAQVKNGYFGQDLTDWQVLKETSPTVIKTSSTRYLQLDGEDYLRQDVFNRLKPDTLYNLSVKGLITNDSLNVVGGITFFDSSWNQIDNITVKLETLKATHHDVEFQVPSGAAKAYVHLRKYQYSRLPGEGRVFSIQISEVGKPAPQPDSSAKLKYAPPVLQNPIYLNVTNEYFSPKLKANQDYVFVMPSSIKTGGGIMIEGGRNVVIIGGHIKMPRSVNTASADQYRRAIYIKNNQGTVHLEGLTIEGDGYTNFDGIAISSPQSIVQVQNMRIVDLFGTNKKSTTLAHDTGFHADIIQPFGGVKALRVDKLTGSSHYQGLQLATSYDPIGRVDLSRVNISSLGEQTKMSGGQLLWLISSNSGFDCRDQFPMTLDQVYLQGRNPGYGFGHTVYPIRNQVDQNGVNCAAVENAAKTEITFPNLPVTGKVLAGPPAAGDFVPANVSGLNYLSPGYLNK